MKFTKMNGIGNDYVYVNCFEEKIDDPIKTAIFVSNRNYGIGSDGLILICPSTKADFKMKMYNADGSEGKMCGNGIRCVGKYVYDNKMTTKKNISVETLSGIKYLWFDIDEVTDTVMFVKVDMGEPIIQSSLVPVKSENENFINKKVNVSGKEYYMTAVSMGNPHTIIYVDNVDTYPIEIEGPKIEFLDIFPDRVNTEFVKVIDRSNLQMRVWERGSGETLACGTGACAVLVASVLNSLSERKATVKLKGGDLKIEWNEEDNHVYMTGSATKVFEGEIEN